MKDGAARSSPSPRACAWMVAGMLAMIALPAAITQHTVRAPAKLNLSSNPTPYGYTVSLLLFIIPIVVIALWFLPHERLKLPRKAFCWTVGILFLMCSALDYFFASRFFLFLNPGATLGIPAPALPKPVPIEEYIFYLTGFIAVLLIYVWLGEFWLSEYNVPDYPGEAKRISRLLRFHPKSAVLAVLLIAGAVVYKKMFSGNGEGFPGYFMILVLGALVPGAAFFPTVRRFINWRAFSLTMFFIVLVSLIWEATLAIPYGWWGYQSKQMLGLFIGAWSGLPIEAVGVWIAVTYATTILFEVIKLWHASEKGWKEAFTGVASSRPIASSRAAGN